MAQPIALLRQHSADLHATSSDARWRSARGREPIWTVNPSHSITGGLPPIFAMNGSGMYGEYFDIPQPGRLIFVSSFFEGDVLRSGCCILTGAGRIFHFSLGGQEYPIHRYPIGGSLRTNAARWSLREQGVQPEPYRLQNMEYGWIDGFVANPPVPHDSLGLTSLARFDTRWSGSLARGPGQPSRCARLLRPRRSRPESTRDGKLED
jgi:hypothetical protein